MTRFQKLALATAATTVTLFAVGGLVRGTGSGLGCSTWPDCEPGRLFPTGAMHSMIEFSHRFLAFAVIMLIVVQLVAAVRHHRDRPAILWLSVAALPLVLAQAVLGGVVVRTDLDPTWVTIHFGFAMALVAVVTAAAVDAWYQLGDRPERGDRAPGDRFLRLTSWTVVMTFALLLVGTYVRAEAAGLVFRDWPLMDGRLVPALGGARTAMFAHRVVAALSALLVTWTFIRARMQRLRTLTVYATVAFVLMLAEVMVGALNVWTHLKPAVVTAHVALSAAIWATLVALWVAARRMRDLAAAPTERAPAGEAEPEGAARSLKETTAAYFQLTKPGIVVLLLITTIPAMMLAQHGIPSVWLMVATLVGGSIAAGSANAINCYLDRDIDRVMRRTRKRPLPAQQVDPERALAFGYVLGAVSFFFLSITVNVLAAALALSAIGFYVFVYTMWLKRSTPQNIVIGGAAGAIPALVGWAAVTGGVGLPAWILFAIVFVWTPPHFWALAMNYRGDYAAAGIPMMPVVRGEEETRRQILLYSLGLFAVSLLLFPLAHMGPVYLATAVVLGGLFVYRALRLWRERTRDLAIGLFRFSIVYLALLFAAVAVDAVLPLAR